MFNEDTTHERTQAAGLFNSYQSLPLAPPPPPPPPRRVPWRWLLFMGVGLMIGITLATIAYAVYFPLTQTVVTRYKVLRPTISPTVAPVQRIPDSAYTAADIIQHIRMEDPTVFVSSTNETIWTFSHNNYFVSAHATSSVQFVGCPTGACADVGGHYGIWVYRSPQEAESAWNQVAADASTCTDTSSSADGMYVICSSDVAELEYAKGRCLLLNADVNSVYGKALTDRCT